MARPRALAVTLFLVGCSVDNSSNPFGATSVGTTYTTVSTTTPVTGDTGSSSETGDGDEESSSTGLGESSSSEGGESSSTDPVGGSSDDGTSDGGGGNGMQPGDGLWSSCASAMDCGVVPALCITIMDAMMNPLAGFCSQTGCSNAAVDCGASPGGTATPMCMPVTVNDMADQACALDCSGGKTCPAPMQCRPLNGGLMVCA